MLSNPLHEPLSTKSKKQKTNKKQKNQTKTKQKHKKTKPKKQKTKHLSHVSENIVSSESLKLASGKQSILHLIKRPGL